jgi:hypothetical protein
MLNGYSNKGHVSRTTHGWETRVIHLLLERDYKVLVNMVTIEVNIYEIVPILDSQGGNIDAIFNKKL